MTVDTPSIGLQRSDPAPMLSGYAALAESAWMGAAQASDVLEPLNIARRDLRPVLPRLPRLRIRSLLTRQMSIAEASFVLMASFFFSAALGAPAFVTHLLVPGFDPRTSDLTVTLTRIMLIQPVILAVGSVATAVLNSRNQFLLTALSVASHNIGLIAGILASRAHPALGIYGPTLGVLAGAVLQVLILLPGMIGGHFLYRPTLDFRDQKLREVVRLLVPNGLAVGVGYAGFILDTAFASKSSQVAALPALHNAFLLVGLPIALLGQAVGQSAFPRLAAYAAEEQWLRMRQTLLRSLSAVVALAVPSLLALILAGRLMIRVLFEHGKYNAAAGSLTYEVLVAYAIALPAYVATEVFTRGLIALRDTRTALYTNVFQIAGRFLIMALLLGNLGVRVVPLAFAVMASIETVILGVILLVKMQRRIHPLLPFTMLGKA